MGDERVLTPAGVRFSVFVMTRYGVPLYSTRTLYRLSIGEVEHFPNLNISRANALLQVTLIEIQERQEHLPVGLFQCTCQGLDVPTCEDSALSSRYSQLFLIPSLSCFK